MTSRSKKENRMSKEQPNPLEDLRRAINKINNQTTLGDTRIIVPGTMLDRAGITDDCVFIRYESKRTDLE
jgi:DNA-binding transcriptional regulator/RsmH inhibitor MraZ